MTENITSGQHRVAIDPAVALSEADASESFWRNRALLLAQNAHLLRQQVEALKAELAAAQKPVT